MKLRVGSRDSRLAVIQSKEIMQQLQKAHPGLELELVTMKTTGDRLLHTTLDKIGGKGLFVKELEQALLDRRVELVVHSLKDLPMEEKPELPILAFGQRQDPRDELVLTAGEGSLREDRPIGCSSSRRALQLKTLFPTLQVAPVRGNVQTRLAKLDSGEFSALVLASAGLKRLGVSQRISRYFSVQELLPAAGQGILAVQCRGEELKELLATVNDPQAQAAALAERAFVRCLNGGCSSPVAAYAEIKGDKLLLSGLYVSPDGQTVRQGSKTAPLHRGESLGQELALALQRGTV